MLLEENLYTRSAPSSGGRERPAPLFNQPPLIRCREDTLALACDPGIKNFHWLNILFEYHLVYHQRKDFAVADSNFSAFLPYKILECGSESCHLSNIEEFDMIISRQFWMPMVQSMNENQNIHKVTASVLLSMAISDQPGI